MSETPIGQSVPGELARLVTSAGGVIVASVGNYQGRQCVDIRKFFVKGEQGLRPTPKGISVEVSRLPALAQLVNDALAQAKARGLVKNGGGR